MGTPNSSSLTLGQNESNLDQDFGYQLPTGAIGDTIWLDADGDGVQGPGESGIPGVTVELTLPDGSTVTTVTDANGNYLFEGLDPGDYTVTVDSSTLPPNMQQTFDDDGLGTPNSSSLSLIQGESNLDQDFGYQPPAGVIGDTIWHDTNGDGIQDPGESGISGVTVELTLPDGSTVTTVTDANGNYLFEGLEPGDYTVTVDPATLPPNMQQTFDDDGLGTPNSSSLTLGEGESNLDQDFGYQEPMGAIGDTIWYDTNGDGVQDPDESGIPGITVALTLPDGSTVTTVTDSNGNYIFEGLEPGDYTVSVDTSTLPDDVSQTFDADGLGTPNSSSLTLDEGERNLDQDFGYQAETGAIGDTIWYDNDGDGVQDPSEGGIPGVTVELTLPDGSTVTTVTDADGNYLFEDLEPGDYIVRVVHTTLPDGVAQTFGPDGPGSPNISNLTLTEGERNLNQDFGYQPQFDLALDKSLAPDQSTVVRPGDDVHYVITVINEGQTTADSVTVIDHIPAGFTLSANDDNGWAVSGTEATKMLADMALAPGQSVQLEIVLTAGNDLSGDIENLAEIAESQDERNQTVADLDSSADDDPDNDAIDEDDNDTASITVEPLASIGSTVWEDIDQDGVQDDDETGLEGVTVNLYDGDGNLIESATTDSNGQYTFDNLIPGDYRVEFQKEPGFQPSPKDVGDDATDSDADPETGLAPVTTLDSGENDATWNAGFYPEGTLKLENSVWYDANQDGIRDSDEAGIADVLVQLFNAEGELIAEVKTDADGNYSIPNLMEGDYYVKYSPPAGYLGTEGGADSAVDPFSLQTPLFSLNVAADDVNLMAGLLRSDDLLFIESKAWFDADKDGILDDNESGLAGVEIKLYDDNGALIATTVTDADGNYSFPSLNMGTYTIEVKAPNGYQLSQLEGDNRLNPDTMQTKVQLNIPTDGMAVNAGFIAAPTGLLPTGEPAHLIFLPIIMD